MNLSYVPVHDPEGKVWRVDAVYVTYLFGERIEVRKPTVSYHYSTDAPEDSLQVDAATAERIALNYIQQVAEQSANLSADPSEE